MKKTLLLFFLAINSIYSQDFSMDWINYEITDVEKIFEDYDSFDLRSSNHAVGYKEGLISYTTQVYFCGPTPYELQTIIYSEQNNTYSYMKKIFDELKSYSKNPTFFYKFSSLNPNLENKNILTGFSQTIGDHIIETGLVNDNGYYLIFQNKLNNGRKYFKLHEKDLVNKNVTVLDMADVSYNALGYDNINPYRLKDYSLMFGTDMLAVHKGTTPLKVMGFLGDGYLSFKDLPDGELGVANGMNNNCIEKISINPDEWNKANKWEKLWVVYHEIAHDIYNIPHGVGGPLMEPIRPKTINYIDFYLAKYELLEYLKTLPVDTQFCDSPQKVSLPKVSPKSTTERKPEESFPKSPEIPTIINPKDRIHEATEYFKLGKQFYDESKHKESLRELFKSRDIITSDKLESKINYLGELYGYIALNYSYYNDLAMFRNYKDLAFKYGYVVQTINQDNYKTESDRFTISGIIQDNNGPLPAAVIEIKGLDYGVSSDFDGNFSIRVQKGDVLLFSFLRLTKYEFVVDKDIHPNKLVVTLTKKSSFSNFRNQ